MEKKVQGMHSALCMPCTSSDYCQLNAVRLILCLTDTESSVPVPRSREHDLEMFGEDTNITKPGIQVLHYLETPELLQGVWNM